MGQITSGVGLVSGINTAQIIDQLLAIEARPKELVTQRNTLLTTQQVAFQSVNAKLLVLKQSAGAFEDNSIFGSTSTSSSDDTVLTATSSTSTVPGSYSFTVDRLVTTQQSISSGFSDQDSSGIASLGGTLTFEFGPGKLDNNTKLNQLNGGNGITRGKIQITDRSGTSQVVDLSKALTVDDVLDAINASSNIAVTASVDGDGFRLDDTSGGGGTLSVSDVGLSGTTASLGLNAAAVGNTLTGVQVNTIGVDTSLNTLNDGNGVRIVDGVDDFQVTRRDGTTFNVDLSIASDLGDAIDAINTASGGNVTASVNANGTGLQLVDTTGSTASNLQVAALNSSNAAGDLGIVGSVAANTLTGSRLVAGLNSKLLGSLNGGSGVTTLGTIDITNRAGTVTAGIDLSTAESVADVISLINNAGAGVTASLNSTGNGLKLSDTTGSTVSNLIVADNTGTAATDLNLAGSVAANQIDSGNLQIQYISEATRLDSLNGGVGVSQGKFTITDSTGATATVDLTQGNETTVGDVISEINSRGLAINARINNNGDGILIEDTGTNVVKLKVEETGSSTARDLGLLGEAKNLGDDLDGSFERTLNIASVISLTGTTNLSALNGGDGVDSITGQDDFSITASDGTSYTVNLDGVTTVNDLIAKISAETSNNVTAVINVNSTGITLSDGTTGSTTFSVSALNNSESALDLGILSSDTDGDDVISGSNIVGITTLKGLTTKINDLGIDITATIINDGTGSKPFRLSLQSDVSGKAGSFVFDDGGLGFGVKDLVEAEDAVVFFGSSDPATAIAITSPTNSLTSVVPNATIDLKGTSTGPVQLIVSRDDAAIVSAAKDFVDDFNDLMGTITDLDSFNPDTEVRGLLLGDPTLASITSSLFRFINSNNTDLTSQFTTLSQVGITVRSGSQLSFDQSKFSAALQTDFDAVEQLFAFKQTATDPTTNEVSLKAGGTLVKIEDSLDRFTDSLTGVIQNRLTSFDRQIALGNERIEFLDQQLEDKRGRLEAEFLAMELALAKIQSQSSSLSALSALIPSAPAASG